MISSNYFVALLTILSLARILKFSIFIIWNWDSSQFFSTCYILMLFTSYLDTVLFNIWLSSHSPHFYQFWFSIFISWNWDNSQFLSKCVTSIYWYYLPLIWIRYYLIFDLVPIVPIWCTLVFLTFCNALVIVFSKLVFARIHLNACLICLLLQSY